MQHDQSRQLLQNALTEAHRNIGSLLNDTEALHSKHLALEDEIIDFKLKLSSALAAPSSSADKTLHEEIQALHERIQELEAALSYFASLNTAEQLSCVPLDVVFEIRRPSC
jgi:predicted RNase H-like nuclease (RuvC/YqgF family)